MAVKRKVMRTRQLHSGMVIDQTIMDQTGRALVEKGALLDDFQIEGLLRHGIMQIYIREGEEDPEEIVSTGDDEVDGDAPIDMSKLG